MVHELVVNNNTSINVDSMLKSSIFNLLLTRTTNNFLNILTHLNSYLQLPYMENSYLVML